MEIPDYLHVQVAQVIENELWAAIKKNNWAVVLGLIPKKDGDQWCVLWGENLMEGIYGFGATPDEAISAFDIAMNEKTGSCIYEDLINKAKVKRD